MGEHSKDAVYFGVAMARDENDRDCGHRAFRMERGTRKGAGRRTWVGPVFPGRDSYPEAAKVARAAFDREFGRPPWAVD